MRPCWYLFTYIHMHNQTQTYKHTQIRTHSLSPPLFLFFTHMHTHTCILFCFSKLFSLHLIIKSHLFIFIYFIISRLHILPFVYVRVCMYVYESLSICLSFYQYFYLPLHLPINAYSYIRADRHTSKSLSPIHTRTHIFTHKLKSKRIFVWDHRHFIISFPSKFVFQTFF